MAGVAEQRPPVRGEMRPEDSRDRAAKRAAELRGNMGPLGMDEGTDRFYIDPETIPAGWSYEWKTKTVMGKDDPAQEVEYARKGWEPVPAERHPEMMPKDSRGRAIERDGMVLMERPAEITAEARDIEYRRARNQVRSKEEQLRQTPEGTLTRDHAKAQPVIRKNHVAMEIPKE